jgi:hypothetical protein
MPQNLSEMNKHLKARDTLCDLSDHPALSLDTVYTPFQLLCVDIVQVCKRGYTEPRKGFLELFYTPKNYNLYKEEFDREFKDYTEEELKDNKGLIQTSVSYKKMYGEEWKPDHIEYWSELNFTVYMDKDLDKWFNRDNWGHFAGTETGGRSFEEMIINTGKEFFKVFGKFNEDDFLTKAEKKNHEKNQLFLTKDSKKGSRLIHNPKYTRVEASEINRRWLKWFIKTDYAKDRWESTFNEVLTGKK